MSYACSSESRPCSRYDNSLPAFNRDSGGRFYIPAGVAACGALRESPMPPGLPPNHRGPSAYSVYIIKKRVVFLYSCRSLKKRLRVVLLQIAKTAPRCFFRFVFYYEHRVPELATPHSPRRVHHRPRQGSASATSRWGPPPAPATRPWESNTGRRSCRTTPSGTARPTP